ncbi:RHS repeat-associated core domain-containing protein [Sphingomonas oryzagri]
MLRSILYFVTFLLFGLAAQAVSAQALPAGYPPLFPNVDANGVDLTSGSFTFRPGTVSLGSAQSSMLLDMTDDIYSSNIYVSTSGSTTNAYIVLDQSTVLFTNSGSGYVPLHADGSSLTTSSYTFTYVDTNGTTFVFSNPYYNYTIGTPCDARPANSCYFLNSITKASGEKLTLNWDIEARCSAIPCTTNKESARLSSVTSNFGYEIVFSYAVASFTGLSPPIGWAQRTRAVLYNLAYCNASTCPTSGISWPTVQFSSYASSIYSPQQITDPMSRTWGITYGTTTNIKWPSSSTTNVTVAYAANGSVASVSKGAQTWTYAYVVSGTTATETVTDPLSHQTVVISDLTIGRPTSVKDALGHTTTYAYDANANLTKITYPEGNYIQFTPDARGNVTQTTQVAKAGSGLANIVTTAGYDTTCTYVAKCNKPNWTKDALGHQTDYTYDNSTGNLLTVTQPAPTTGGVRPQTRYTYTAMQAYYHNASGSIVASGTSISMLTGTSACRTTASCSGTADEVKATIGYGPQTAGTANNLLAVSVAKGSGDGTLTSTTAATYDPFGNLASVDGPLAGTADTSTYFFDADRELTEAVGPDPDGTGSLKNRAQRNTYNADGLVTLVEQGTANPDGGSFSALQDIATGYDSVDRKAQDSAQAGGTTYAVAQYSYDAASRLQCTAQRMNPSTFASLPTSACTLATSGSYGPDRITLNTYDNADELLKVTTGYGVTTANGFPATLQRDEETVTYSNNGKVKTVADAKNNRTTYVYDGFDRLSQTQYPSPTTPGTSNAADYEQLGYDAAGNVTGRRLRGSALPAGSYDIAYGYDGLNRLSGKTLPSPEHAVSYAYDNLGEPTTITGANTLTYGFDNLGRMTSETQAYGSVGYQYDLANRRTRLTWQDGTYLTYDYDTVNEMIDIKESGSTILASFTYDDLGERKTRTLANGTSTTYGYDAVSRLTSLALAGGTNANTATLSNYSPAGEIGARANTNDAFAWTQGANVARGYTINGLNQFATIAGATQGYDGRGNLTNSGGTTYAYTAENRLKSVSTGQTLTYDPIGRLGEYDAPTSTRFVYDGGMISEELNTSGGVLRRYVFGPAGDEPIVWYEGSTTVTKRYIDQDERGSVTRITNADGSTYVVNSYDEYGIPASSNQGRFGYTGQAWLPEIGLAYYKARIYSPTLGRFLQTDPIGYADGPNWYNYAGSNPINSIDPTGTCEYVWKGFTDGHSVYLGTYGADCGKSNTGGSGNTGGVGSGPSKPGGGNGGRTIPAIPPKPQRVANHIDCNTKLPDGTTVGSHIAALSNTINGSASTTSTPYGPSGSYSSGYSPLSIPGQVYRQTNFKIMFRGQGNAAFLGDAGNFAYGAVSANIGVPLSATEAVAGAYAWWAGHPDNNGPWGMDSSATAQVPAGYGASCGRH